MRRFASLRRRAEFSRLRQRGRRTSTSILTLYRSDPGPADRRSLVGISVSKTVGKAVVRNTLRRRIAAILHDVLAGRPPLRLLVVPRPAAAELSFAALRRSIELALA